MSTTDAFWSRYDSLLARLLSPLTPDDGCPEEEVAAAEERLGFHLPRLLREFYLRAEANEILMSPAENEFVAPADLEVQSGWLTIWVENQGVVLVGLRASDAGTDDPSVAYTWSEDYSDADELTVPLSVFLMEMLLMQCAVHDMNYSAAADTAELRVPPSEADGWERIVSLHNGGEFFVRDGQVVWINGTRADGYSVHAGARSEEDAEAINAAFGVELEFFK